MDKNPQFWNLKDKKGKPFGLKLYSKKIEIPENTVEKVIDLFFDHIQNQKKMNLFLGVKPQNDVVEIKFFLSKSKMNYYRSKNSSWRFFLLPIFRIKKIKIEFSQIEPKVSFVLEP